MTRYYYFKKEKPENFFFNSRKCLAFCLFTSLIFRRHFFKLGRERRTPLMQNIQTTMALKQHTQQNNRIK
jgi:hypothetical protein